MKKFKAFIEEFKKFISRGNILDMAIGVIVASSFTAIVTSLTNKIIMPCINWILSLGGTNGLESAYSFLKKVYFVDSSGNQTIDLSKSIYIDWGAFITAILNFFLIALVLFVILKIFNKAVSITKEINEKVITLSKKEIKKLKKQGLTDEEINQVQQKVEEKSVKNEEKKPTTDELLTEILKVIKEEKQVSIKEESGDNNQKKIDEISNN